MKIVLKLVLCLVLLACNSEQEALPSWLLGTWQINDGSNYETWEKSTDRIFSGRSFEVKGQDTVLNETIKLIQQEHTIFYIPTVVNQNEGKPVSFKLVDRKSDQLVFENKQHDFPQKIMYEMKDQNTILVTISALADTEKSIDFHLKRIN